MLRPMSGDVLIALKGRLDEDLDGISVDGDALEAITDARYGEVTIRIEHEPEAESLRISVSLPSPAGAGPSFLVWCLSTNTQYWDAKLGLGDDGLLVVHADVDVDDDLIAVANRIIDRVDTILELIDDDLVEWILHEGLGTPAQRERWRSRAPVGDTEDVDA
jgi:hypothetical protein